jgi:hypothetical protein
LNIVHIKRNAEEEKGAAEKQLGGLFSGVPHQFQIVNDSQVKHGIEAYLQEHPTDLLVMVTRERGFWERIFGKSHTKQMVY